MIKPGRKPYLIPMVGIFLAMAMVMVVSACAGEQIDREELGQLVREAVQEAAPEPQESLTAEDVEKIVQGAMMEADTGEEEPALTAQEVQQIVQSAMEAQAGMAMEDALSAEDVQKIVQDAMMASAMTEDTLTPEEIEKIVEDAMTAGAMMMEQPKEVIVFADLNWSSAQIQNAIARYIVENGYGYPTDAIFGGTIPLFQGLLDGEIHVTMEIWLPNQQEPWDKALADRAVIPVGKSIQENWQSSFVVPTYVLEQNPSLVTVQDLRDHTDLFEQEEGKVILVGCPAGWACEEINKEMVTAYGLDDIVTVQTAGGQESLFASFKSAFDKGEPWIGYLWAPTLHSGRGLSRLEEPPYSDECWATTKGCNYGPADVTIAVHPTMVQRAPEVIEFLRQWDLISPIAEEAEIFMDANDLTFRETAIRYLKNNEAEWTSWVTHEVAQKVKAALANE